MTSTLDLLEVASNAGGFDLFVAAVYAAGLDDLLAEDGPFTVLAPTNAAFGQLSDMVLESLLDRRRSPLRALVQDHIVPGRWSVAALTGLGWVDSLAGRQLVVDCVYGLTAIDAAILDPADMAARNGILHAVDRVLGQDLRVPEVGYPSDAHGARVLTTSA